jgi:hypothetical protein
MLPPKFGIAGGNADFAPEQLPVIPSTTITLPFNRQPHLGQSMDLAAQIYESVKPLNPAAAWEVLDFVEFLRQRQARQEDRDLMIAQHSAMADWDNPDDDAWNDAPAV